MSWDKIKHIQFSTWRSSLLILLGLGQLKVDEDESEDTSAEAAKKPEDGGDAAAAPTQQPAHTGSTLNVHPLLSSVVNYTHPTHFAGIFYIRIRTCRNYGQNIICDQIYKFPGKR